MDFPHFEHVEAAIDRAAQTLPAVPPAPDWRPLEALLDPALIGQFMAMGEATAPDGTAVKLYKHGMTRRYLNVSADLRTWQYCNATYRLLAVARATWQAWAPCPTARQTRRFCGTFSPSRRHNRNTRLALARQHSRRRSAAIRR